MFGLNTFRTALLFLVAGCAFLTYQSYFSPSSSSALLRGKRSPVVRRQLPGQCKLTFGRYTFQGNSYEMNEVLVYSEARTRDEAQTTCANLPDGPYTLGQVQERSVIGVRWNDILGDYCSDFPQTASSESTWWIGSWNGDSYNGQCIALTKGQDGKMSVVVRDCQAKYNVWCSKKPNLHLCSECSPYPGGPQCHITASCTRYRSTSSYVENSYYCACRSGYKAAAGQPSWRLSDSDFQMAPQTDKNRVHVPPGVACDNLCDNWALANRCEEVTDTCEACFPGDATVVTRSGSNNLEETTIKMEDVKVGTEIKVAVGKENREEWTEVALAVRLGGMPDYTELQYLAGNRTESITMTANHLVPVQGAKSQRLIQAMHVNSGDFILHRTLGPVKVTKTQTAPLNLRKAYTLIPLKPSMLIVDGIVVSPYAQSPEMHTYIDTTFGTALRILYRILKAVGHQDWLDSETCHRMVDAVRGVALRGAKDSVKAAGAAGIAIVGWALVKRVKA